MAELTKYGVARHFYLVLVKRAVVDFAVSADWTPAAGDVKISIDGGAAANVTNLPVAIAMGNTAIWDFSMTSGEMTGKQMVITVADSATKAVEDQSIRVETYGNASAQHAFDLNTATVVASSVTAVGTGAIAAASFASGAIDATAIATDAIGSAELATTAVNEIRDAIVALLAGRTGTAQAGAAGTITLDSGAVATDDFYKGQMVLITSGTGAGQVRLIHSYVGSTKVATIGDNWATNPDNTSVFTLVPARVYTSLIKTDAVNAAALATDAVTELQTGLATSTALASVQADTDDIQTRLPATLVSGRIDANVGAMAANTVTAAAIATDAIGAAELAADAVTEIQSGLATASALAAVQADTDDIQTRLPAALVSGRMDASVGAMAADVLTAAAVATDALGALELAAGAASEIATAVWAQTMSELSAVPVPTDSVLAGLEWLVALNRNLRVQTTTTETVYKDDGTTVLATAAKTDVNGTFNRGEYS